MNILQVVHGFPPKQIGGTQLYVQDLSKELSKRNEVHVFYPRYEGGRWHVDNFAEQEIINHELMMPFGLLRLRYRATKLRSSYLDRKTEQLFAHLLDTVRPDIVHVQHLIYLSASIVQVAKRSNVPVVLSLHDYWLICPLTNLLKSDFSLCQGPNRDCSNCFECWNKGMGMAISSYISMYNTPPDKLIALLSFICKKRNPIKDFMARTTYMKSLLLAADKIVAPSKFIEDLFIRFGVPSDKIIYSDKGYNLSRFNGFKKSPTPNRTKLIFGYVGGLLKYKGVEILIEAFNRMNPEHAELIIYGDYDQKSKDFLSLRSRIKNSNIKFTGRYQDIRKPYAEIDVLVFPSICYENRPLVLTEALIAQVPIIASNLGSIPEIVEDKKNGLLFRAGDPEDLYHKMMMIVENPALLDNLKVGPHQVKSIQSHAEEIEGIYRDILRRTNR